MKRLIFITTLFASIVGVKAQQLAQNQSAIIYYMPKTEIIAEVEYQRIENKVGMFYQYSKLYLGTDDIVTQNKTSYVIKSVRLHTRAVADANRYHILNNTKNTPGINLTDDGILCAINTACEKMETGQFEQKPMSSSNNSKSLVPLGEDQMLSGSVAKMAEGTAKQIYRIRENRFNLLSGEIDNMPTDGSAVKLILDELSEQEKNLCALFVGTRDTTTAYAYYTIDPGKNIDNEVLFRFSSFSGPVEPTDYSGSPVFISLKTMPMTYLQDEKNSKKYKADKNAIYYNIPGKAEITIKDGNKLLNKSVLTIAQLGIEVPIDPSWLNKKITINPVTGLIRQIE